MSIPLRLLIVEDNPADAELVLCELHRAGYAPHWKRIETENEFLASLQSPLDLIIADYALPQFSGARALSLLRESALDIPFIFVSGTIGEDMAVEAMKNGATDYLLKDRLARLVPSVSQALEQKRVREDKRRAEQAVRDSERRFRALIENSDDAVALISPRGTILYETPVVCRILGYMLEERIGSNLFSRIHPDERDSMRAQFEQLVQERGLRLDLELREQHKDGSWRWLEASGANLLSEPSVQAIVWNYRDITQRKQAEHALRESEERYRRRADEFAELYETTRDLAKPQALSALLQTIAERAASLLNAPGSAIYLYDAAQQALNLAVQSSALPFPMHLQWGEGVAGRVAQLGEAMIVDEYRTWAHRSPQVESSPEFVSVVGVPLLYAGELIGVLVVGENSATRKFMDADVRLLSLFASQAASAVHNARLLAQTRRRLAELEAVNRLSSALRTAQTLEQMLPIILDETLAVLNTDAGIIRLYDPNTNTLQAAVARGWITQVMYSLPIENSIAGKVFTSDQPYLVQEFQSDPFVYPDLRSQLPAGWRGAAIPVRAGHAPIGVLLVAVRQPRALQADELHLLSILAEIAGNAIHRARLFEETERRVQHLSALHKVDMAITSSVDLHVTLNVLLDQVTSQLGIHAAAILLLDPHTQTLEYAIGRGFRTDGIICAHVRLGENYAGRVALERRMLAVPNLSQAMEDAPRAAWLAGESFVAYVGIPLIAKGEVKGVLELYHRAPLNPDPDWLEFLETLASQAAIALDNTALFEKLQRSNLELVLAYDTTLEGWSRALDLRDKETEGHTLRVTETTLRLARELGLNEVELVHMRRGALLHDIGKMAIPDSILLKPGPLTQAEWAIMKLHPVYAYELLSPITFLRRALDIPYCHHEKWDGTGYPRGLKGEAIPIAARIFAVVDVWDALLSDRPYRRGWPADKVREHLRSLKGSHFDASVVNAFLNMEPEAQR